MTASSDVAEVGSEGEEYDGDAARAVPGILEAVLGDIGNRLTPEGVRRIEFPRTPLGRRGYNEADVERFRDRVVHEIGKSSAEKAELRQEIQRLRDYYRRNRVDLEGADRPSGRRAQGAAGTVDSDRPSAQAVNVMSAAQQAADQHIARAEDYARRLVANARVQYEDILLSAHEQAERAAAEASRLYEAGLAASNRSTGDPGMPPGEMQELESRLAYMRTFTQVTQVQLRSILDALREELDHLTVLPQPGGGQPGASHRSRGQAIRA
jgi:cell division initiation protein